LATATRGCRSYHRPHGLGAGRPYSTTNDRNAVGYL